MRSVVLTRAIQCAAAASPIVAVEGFARFDAFTEGSQCERLLFSISTPVCQDAEIFAGFLAHSFLSHFVVGIAFGQHAMEQRELRLTGLHAEPAAVVVWEAPSIQTRRFDSDGL